MIPVADVYPALFKLIDRLEVEDVPLASAAGRALAHAVAATRTQPPFAASSMDGYALKAVEADLHAQFQIIGEAAAGHGFSGHVGAGQALSLIHI